MGELSPDADRDVLADMLIGRVYHRLLISQNPPTPEFPDKLAVLTLGPHLLTPAAAPAASV